MKEFDNLGQEGRLFFERFGAPEAYNHYRKKYKNLINEEIKELAGLKNNKEKEIWKIYKNETEWDDSIWNLADGSAKLEKLGRFNLKTNPNGVMRERKFSIKKGFQFKVFPEIIKHPANCELTQHFNKGKRVTITLDGLFRDILNWNKEWHEHEYALYCIDWYLSGERWKI